MVRGLGTLQLAIGRLFSDDRFFFKSCVEVWGLICDRKGFCRRFTWDVRGDMGTGCGDAAAMDLALCFQRRRCVVRGCYSHIPKAYPSGPRVQKSSECSTELSFKLRVGFRVRAVRGRTAQCHHTHTAHITGVIQQRAARNASPPPPSAVLSVQPPPDFISQPHVCGGV